MFTLRAFGQHSWELGLAWEVSLAAWKHPCYLEHVALRNLRFDFTPQRCVAPVAWERSHGALPGAFLVSASVLQRPIKARCYFQTQSSLATIRPGVGDNFGVVLTSGFKNEQRPGTRRH